MTVHDDLRDLLRLLNAHRVEYLVIGGYAVAFHGFIRATKDIDLFFRNTPANIRHLMDALLDFGISPDMMDEELFARPGQVVRIGHPPAMVEMLNAMEAVSFDEAWASRQRGHYGGEDVAFISLEHLLANKKAVGRPRDLRDIEELTDGES